MKNIPAIIFCIVLFGFSSFFRKITLDKIHPYQLQVIATGIYIALLPVWIYLSSRPNIPEYTSIGIIFGIICIIIYIIGSVVFGFLLRDTDHPGVLIALASLSPIITIVMTVAFLHEQFTFWKIIAFIFALLSAILVNF